MKTTTKDGHQPGGGLRLIQGDGAGRSPAPMEQVAKMQPLAADIRTRLREDDPMPLLGYLSAILHLSPDEGDEDGLVPVADLVDSFANVDIPETTAALQGLQPLIRDESICCRVRAALTERHQPMPLWLSAIAQTSVTGVSVVKAASSTHVLLGIQWGCGARSTYIIHLTHAGDTMVRDAFPTSGDLDISLPLVHDLVTKDGTEAEMTRLSLASARALLESAMANGDQGIDPDSPSWPAGRPIVEWLLTTIPEPA